MNKNEEYYLLELDKIDWDFSDELTNSLTHAFHPYPAKFIPQIPRVFITLMTNPGDTVYDPFLGCGTTAVEANANGRNAIGNDVNELAVLISKVKTSPLKDEQLAMIDIFLSKCKGEIESSYKNNLILDKPNILNLDLWFKDYVINEISIIKQEIKKINDLDVQDFCFVALSSIIVSVSNQDSDTRYVRVSKNINNGETFLRFERQLRKLSRMMNISKSSLAKGRSRLIIADSRVNDIFPANSSHLAITSPPYPNAYDYHLYHKYRLFWLDMDPYALRKREIGAHADYSKKNGSNEFDFENDMNACFKCTSNILLPKSFFVLVMGNSILKGRLIDNSELLKESAKSTPFIFVKEYERKIKLSKKSFNPVIGNIKYEKILIFRNEK